MGDMAFDSTLLKIPYIDVKKKNLPRKTLPKIVLPKIIIANKKNQKQPAKKPKIAPELKEEWDIISRILF